MSASLEDRQCGIRLRVPVSLLTLTGTSGHLVAHAVVLFLHTLNLLLQILHVAVLGCELVLELSNLASATNVLERGALLPFGLAFECFELLLEAESVKDHDIGAVQNE